MRRERKFLRKLLMEFYQSSIEIVIDYIRKGASVIWNDTRAAKGSLVCLTAKLHLYVMQMNKQCKQIFLQKQKQKNPNKGRSYISKILKYVSIVFTHNT